MPARSTNTRPRRRQAALIVGFVCASAATGFLAARLFGPRPPGLIETTASVPPRNSTSDAGGEPNPARDTDGDGDTGGSNGISPPPRRLVPETVPDISLSDRSGTKRSLARWKGRPLMINFWATWCEPCRREIPLLKMLRRERVADGVEVIGIAVDFREAVERYAQKMSIDYPVLVGEQDGFDAITAFGMETVFPFTVFADSQGRIVTLKVGELRGDEARYMLDRVSDVDHGRMSLPAARKAISDETARLAAARARSASSQDPGAQGGSKPY